MPLPWIRGATLLFQKLKSVFARVVSDLAVFSAKFGNAVILSNCVCWTRFGQDSKLTTLFLASLGFVLILYKLLVNSRFIKLYVIVAKMREAIV